MYVPLDRVKDVEAWTKEYKRLKQLIRAVTLAALGELLVVELTDEDVLLNFDDVVEVLEVAALLPQDTSIRDDRMRMQITNKYNFLFILSPYNFK